MKINWDDLVVKFDKIDLKRLLENWIWLIGKDKIPILISSIGDLFFKDNEGICYWLNVGEGKFDKVAESVSEFNLKLKNDEIVKEWFLIDLILDLKNNGLELTEKKLYSYKKLPIIGGEYKPNNFELIDIELHFELFGLIHKQIKDLPDGTNVRILPKW